MKCERCSGADDVQDTEYIVRKAFGAAKSQFVWSRAVLCRPCREGLAETIGRWIERKGDFY